jgi:hypothetical protein
MDKQTKEYKASMSSVWYERWTPDKKWWLALAPADTILYRIWPAGNYTVDVRADASSPTVLKRRQLNATVCATACIEYIMASNASSEEPGWAFFGGGPWVSWGSSAQPEVLRLYDLTGEHSVPSPFAQSSWFTTGGSMSKAVPRMSIASQTLTSGDQDIRAFAFTVAPDAGVSSYVFGFAWDPDLDAPADDRSGYDTQRSMVYAVDASSAVGCFILVKGRNDIVGVDQYGVAKRPPAAQMQMYDAQRKAGIHLLDGPSDVQYMIAARPTSGLQTWTVVFVKGRTLADLQKRADAGLAMFKE